MFRSGVVHTKDDVGDAENGNDVYVDKLVGGFEAGIGRFDETTLDESSACGEAAAEAAGSALPERPDSSASGGKGQLVSFEGSDRGSELSASSRGPRNFLHSDLATSLSADVEVGGGGAAEAAHHASHSEQQPVVILL